MYLILRPQPRLQRTLDYFTAHGVETKGLALLALTPDKRQLADFARQVTAFSGTLLFTSPTAAEFALQAVKHWPPQLQVIAVGPGTAEPLKRQFSSVIVPHEATSEGLLALPELQRAEYVYLVKGHGGRTLLTQQLTKAGKSLKIAKIYQRERRVVAQKTDWQIEQIRSIIVTSGDMLEAAFGYFSPELLCDKHWVVISERVASLAREKGIDQISISQGTADKDLFVAATQQGDAR